VIENRISVGGDRADDEISYLCKEIGFKPAESMYDEEEKPANAELLAKRQTLEQTEHTLTENHKMLC
jgi:hypothetical protein